MMTNSHEIVQDQIHSAIDEQESAREFLRAAEISFYSTQETLVEANVKYDEAHPDDLDYKKLRERLNIANRLAKDKNGVLRHAREYLRQREKVVEGLIETLKFLPEVTCCPVYKWSAPDLKQYNDSLDGEDDEDEGNSFDPSIKPVW
jgi:hypothetical protein